MGFDTDNIAAQLDGLLPDRAQGGPFMPDRSRAAAEKAREMARRAAAAGVAKAKAAALAKQKRAAMAEAAAEAEGIPVQAGQTLRSARAAARRADEARAADEAQAALLASPPSVPDVADVPPAARGAVLRLQGTSRPELDALLRKLGLDLSVRLTKNDTANLLACLLTCSETQLKALRGQAKVPVVIKTVINRILEDADSGSMATVLTLWERVFGKAPLSDPGPAQADAGLPGILPGQPVSREAYVVIRDTLMK